MLRRKAADARSDWRRMENSGRGNARETDSARHQPAARELNERSAALNRRWGTDTFPSSFVCECVDPNCNERILLSHETYEQLRQTVGFVTLPGH